jgi:hypothetical protein
MEQQTWQQQAYVSSAQRLIADGFVVIDESGDTVLTEKGKQRAAARLDKLPDGDEILLDLAFCSAHDIPVSIF